MKIKDAVEIMRTVVETYDKFEAKKLKIKRKTKALLKGDSVMKFGTVIGIVVGALALIAAGAAAAYFYFKKNECCCDDCCCDCDEICCDEDLFEEFPEEEYCTEEAPEEEAAE